MATSVKIKKEDILSRLRARLSEMEKDIEARRKADDAFEKAKDAYEQKVLAIVAKSVKKATRHNINDSRYGYNGEVNVDLWFPKELFPERPIWEYEGEHVSRDDIKELQRTIALVEMADNDLLSVSAFKEIKQYL